MNSAFWARSQNSAFWARSQNSAFWARSQNSAFWARSQNWRDLGVIAALVACMVGATVLIASFGSWVVEDAAISFAYARNWVDGHGLVPYVGGERVEGYSNPTWVVLLAVLYRFGVDPFLGAKFLAMAFTAATVPLVYGLGAAAAPAQPRLSGLVAVLVFSCNAQVAIFGAAGLENPLFHFLLALGLWQLRQDLVSGRVVGAASVFLVLAWTRPEGIAYATVPLLAILAKGRYQQAGRFLVALFVPFLLGHAVRYAYFAWPWPMTFYAKAPTGFAGLVDLDSRGWRYVRSFAVVTGWVFMLPGLLAAVALNLREPVRVSALGFGALGVAFAVYAQGDWMGGYRFLSVLAVPTALLLGAGVAELMRVHWLGAGVGVAAVGLFAAWNVQVARDYGATRDVSPFHVRNRMLESQGLLDRLQLDERAQFMTFDMGGFMWWADAILLDDMGLTDVPMAVHNDHRDALFVDYVLNERRPHMMRLPRPSFEQAKKAPGFADAYVPIGHDSALRRDLLFSLIWSGEAGRQVRFSDGDVVLHGIEVESPEVDDALSVRLGLSNPGRGDFTVQVVLLDASDVPVAAWPIEPAFGLVPPAAWRAQDVWVGRVTLQLPEGLPTGIYALGLRVWVDGELVGSDSPAIPGALEDGTVKVSVPVLIGGALAAAQADRALVMTHATAGRCEDAERSWRLARWHLPMSTAFVSEHGPQVRRALAQCLLARALSIAPVSSDDLVRARAYDATTPGLAAASDSLADDLMAEGRAHMAERRWQRAYAAYSEAVRVEPSRAWARRHAEDARVRRRQRFND